MSIGAGTSSTRDTENVWGPKDMTGTILRQLTSLIPGTAASEERHESFAAAGCGPRAVCERNQGSIQNIEEWKKDEKGSHVLLNS